MEVRKGAEEDARFFLRASTTWQRQRNGGGKAQTDGGPSQSVPNRLARRSRRGEDRIVPSLTKTRFPEEHVDGEGGEHGSALRKSLLHVKSSCAGGIQSEHVGLPQEILRFAKISKEKNQNVGSSCSKL